MYIGFWLDFDDPMFKVIRQAVKFLRPFINTMIDQSLQVDVKSKCRWGDLLER
jgi:hypothetical protein